MRVTYDAEVDILGIELRPGVGAEYGEDLAPGITAAVAANGQIVAIDIADYAKRYGQKAAEQVIVEHYLARPRARQVVEPAADLSGYAEGQPGTWLSVPEAARRAEVSDQAIRQALKEGRLRGLPLRPGSSHMMVAEASLAAWQPNRMRQAAGKARKAE